MDMLLTLTGFILAFIVALYYQHKIKLAKPRNNVHFYVARHKDGSLWLYSGKPIKSRFSFVSSRFGKAVTLSDHFSKFGLNINDYDNLKWEDGPVEVFVNKET